MTIKGANYKEVKEVVFEVEGTAGVESLPATHVEVKSPSEIVAVAPELEGEGGVPAFAVPFGSKAKVRAKVRVVTPAGASATRADIAVDRFRRVPALYQQQRSSNRSD